VVAAIGLGIASATHPTIRKWRNAPTNTAPFRGSIAAMVAHGDDVHVWSAGDGHSAIWNTRRTRAFDKTPKPWSVSGV
jgi:hypothetical protein